MDGGDRLTGWKDPGRELEAELSFHLELRAKELEGEGLTPDEARRRAAREFGDVDRTRRYCEREDRRRVRRARGRRLLRGLADELAMAVRALVRRPGQVLAPGVILALAIGLNVLVFTVVRGVLLAPLPFTGSDRVLVVEEVAGNGGLSRAAYPILDAWRRESRAVEGVTGYLDDELVLLGMGEPRRIRGALVTRAFFDLLDSPLLTGRAFSADDHQPGAAPAVLISEGLWRTTFASDPGILRRTLRTDGDTYSILGVVRNGRGFPDDADVWVPLESANPDLMEIAGAKILVALARLRTGVTVEEAEAELGTISARIPGGAPSASVTSLTERLLGDVRGPLLLLQGAVLLVLLAACANAGGMLLARGVRRRWELAVRASVGAGASRVAGGRLLEGLLLGSAAGLVGLALAAALLKPALSLVPVDLPRTGSIALDPGAALFALALAVGTGLATALLPAVSGARTSPGRLLSGGGAGDRTSPRLRSVLEGFVVLQVALAVLLTAGAGLLLRSFILTVRENPGFDPARVTLMEISLPAHRYSEEASRLAFARDLLEGAERLPGTQAAALGRNLPITGSNMTSPLMVEGSSGQTRAVQIATVTAAYFDVLRIPFVDGSGFGDADRPDGPPLLLVDSGVRTAEGAGVGVGDQAYSFFGRQTPRDVVGVVGQVRHRGLRAAPVPIAYEPFFQRGGATGFTLLVRSSAPPAAVTRGVRELVASLDPDVPLDRAVTMSSAIRRSVAEPRFYTVVLSLFGGLAVLLALAGCQAGLAHRVAARRKEIGLRMALGASAASVRSMVLRRGLGLTLAGAAAGLLAAIPATRVLESQLYGVTAADPVTYAVLLALLLGAGALASDLPARRASSLDPADVLRQG